MMKIQLLKISKTIFLMASIAIFGTSCGGGEEKKETPKAEKSKPAKAPIEEVVAEYGVGPVEYVDISGEIDQARVDKGKAIFEGKCTACHKFNERYVGPDLAGLTDRRNPAWIMNMILNPEEMTKKDPIAKKLLGEYLTQMVNQNVTEEDARNLLEYIRAND